MKSFGQTVKSLRNERGLSQHQLAQSLGVAQTTIANYETDKRFPNHQLLVRMAESFDTSVDYLLGRVTEKESTVKIYEGLDEKTLEPVYQEVAQKYLGYLMDSKKYAALNLVRRELGKGLDPRSFYDKVFMQTQRRIGRMWERNEINVAREHYITNVTQTAIASLFTHLSETVECDRVAVTLAVNGDPHTVGAQMMSDLLAFEGWNTHFLGGNVPTDQLIETLVELKAGVLVLTLTLSQYMETLENTMYALRKEPQLKSLKIIIGGRALDKQPEAWRQLGADGYGSSFEEAVRLVKEMR
ncbi:MAG: hypothetical protein AVO33_02585 [delta proteobacterium ML8_F1]|nr:MAG: hypothetical protein AVO33_02585 [delta proteobacterium ML8_F1]